MNNRIRFALATALLLASVGASAQSAEELNARVDRAARANERAVRQDIEQSARAAEAGFQARAGRTGIRRGERRALEASLGISGEGGYWQAPRGKGGRYVHDSKREVLILRDGTFCKEVGFGMTISSYSCYRQDGSPFAGFEWRFGNDSFEDLDSE